MPKNKNTRKNRIRTRKIQKKSKVNKSNVKGYYADVNFSNNSRNKVELFSVGAEIQQSSK